MKTVSDEEVRSTPTMPIDHLQSNYTKIFPKSFLRKPPSGTDNGIWGDIRYNAFPVGDPPFGLPFCPVVIYDLYNKSVDEVQSALANPGPDGLFSKSMVLFIHSIKDITASTTYKVESKCLSVINSHVEEDSHNNAEWWGAHVSAYLDPNGNPVPSGPLMAPHRKPPMRVDLDCEFFPVGLYYPEMTIAPKKGGLIFTFMGESDGLGKSSGYEAAMSDAVQGLAIQGTEGLAQTVDGLARLYATTLANAQTTGDLIDEFQFPVLTAFSNGACEQILEEFGGNFEFDRKTMGLESKAYHISEADASWGSDPYVQALNATQRRYLTLQYRLTVREA